MVKVLLYVLPVLLFLGLVVFALADLIRTDESRVRALPKMLWVFVIILLPLVGSLVWILVGKERLQPSTFGPPPQHRPRRPSSPDDDPEFLNKIDRELDRERRIRDLEEQLKQSKSDDDEPDGKP